MGPLCRAVPKALLPLPGDGDAPPVCVLHRILADARDAGARQAVLVVRPDHRPLLQAYLDAARDHPASPPLPDKIDMVPQETPAGFGDAVLLARDRVADRDMLLMLGDHVYSCDEAPTPARQVVEAFTRADRPAAMIGVQDVDADELPRVGTVRGEPLEASAPRGGKGVYRCTAFVEKPSPREARTTLRTPGLPADRYLAHGGIYVFTPEIFECLAFLVEHPLPGRDELELADAQTLLLERQPDRYLLCHFAGRALDTGNPAGYRSAWQALSGPTKGPR
jgi:UTP--glucose-1-phosphate uridylyltransferase